MAASRNKQQTDRCSADKKTDDGPAAARVILKNLVYVIGLPESIASEQILGQDRYFGQYGAIQKIVVNKDKPFSRKKYGASTYSAYVTYSTDTDASLAILAVQDFQIQESTVKTSYGTTKFCCYYLKKKPCKSDDCLYLHGEAPKADILYPKDISNNRDLFDHLKQDVYRHLAPRAKHVLHERKYLDVPHSVFPGIQIALARLHDHCLRHKLLDEEGKIVEEAFSPVSAETSIRKKASLSTTCTERGEDRDSGSPNESQEAVDRFEFYSGFTGQDKLILDRLQQSLLSLKTQADGCSEDRSEEWAGIKAKINDVQSLIDNFHRAAESRDSDLSHFLTVSMFDSHLLTGGNPERDLKLQNSSLSDKLPSTGYSLFRQTKYKLTNPCIKMPSRATKPKKTPSTI